MRINTVSARPQVETPGWNAPSGEDLATIYTDLQTGPAGPAAAQRRPRHHQPPTPSRHHTNPAAPNHHRHPDQPAPPTPTARSMDLRPGPRHRTSPPPEKTTPPVSAPPTPIVRSRPPVHSAPPVRPSTPPVPPPRPADRPPVPALHPAERPPVPPLRPAESSPAEIGTPPPPSEQGPRRSLTWLIAAIVVVLAAAGITGYLAINGHRHAASRPSQTVLPFTGPNWPRHQPLPPRRPPPPVRRAAIFPENGNPATTNVQRA
jgi:hypothetical protein